MVPGSFLARSVPIAAFGFAIAMIGSVILLVVPGPVSEDAYKAFLNDATKNIEVLIEELGLGERAYFFQTERGEIRAFIPVSGASKEATVNWPPPYSLPLVGMESNHLVVDNGNQKGLLLIPPGAQLVKLARLEKGEDLEMALRSVLVESSAIASSVLAIEEKESKTIRVKIGKPAITWESSSLRQCLGSPSSCVASCVAAVVKGGAIRILDEKLDSTRVLLSLEMI